MPNKGTTGTIFITSLVWCGPCRWIEPRTSRTRSQHYTTRLSRRRWLHKWEQDICFRICEESYKMHLKVLCICSGNCLTYCIIQQMFSLPCGYGNTTCTVIQYKIQHVWWYSTKYNMYGDIVQKTTCTVI